MSQTTRGREKQIRYWRERCRAAEAEVERLQKVALGWAVAALAWEDCDLTAEADTKGYILEYARRMMAMARALDFGEGGE